MLNAELQAANEEFQTNNIALFESRRELQNLNQQLELRVAQRTQELASLNEELRAANQQLTRINADLDTFVYVASHDLRAPIANIEGLLQALHQELPAEALQAPLVLQILDLIQSTVARFQQTISHLTDISKLQLAHTEPAVAVDLKELAEDVRLDLASLLQAAAAHLTIDVDACSPVRIAAKTLRSILYNLLSNAVKYRASDREPVVQLRCRHMPGRLLLEVQDNGLGLSSSQQEQLFSMFLRLHHHVEGSGVGLYAIKRLVENLGGLITVQSEVGVGSTFTVSLPIEDQPAP